MGLLIGLLATVFAQEDAKDAQARATVEMLAGCVDLYQDYTGREATSLSQLTKPASDDAFWPEGGFFPGDLPKDPWEADYRIADGKIVCSREGIAAPVKAPQRTRIVPPAGRLKDFYSARAHLQILNLATRRFLKATGKLPTRREDLPALPKDPWGGEYLLESAKDAAIMRVADPEKLRVTLTDEEKQALGKAASVELSADERKAIAEALDRMRDDDFAVREEAGRRLLRFGKALLGPLDERLASEKDRHAKRWLRQLKEGLPKLPDSWEAQSGPLFAIVQTAQGADVLEKCRRNFTRFTTAMRYFSMGIRDRLPTETGGGFWPAMLGRVGMGTTLQCPGIPAGPEGTVSYRGPAADANTYAKDDPIGMCDAECHGGLVIVVDKSGNVETYLRIEPSARKAFEKTKK